MSTRRRAGVPLSVKLMLTTSIVVAVAIAISTWSSQQTIARLNADDARARRTAGEQAIVRESELLARNIANASAIPMAQHAYGEVGPLLTATRAEYPRIQWIAIGTEAGQLVASTPGAPAVVMTDFPQVAAGGAIEHRRLAPDRPDWIYASGIRLGDQVVGQLRLGVSTKDLDEQLQAGVRSVACVRDRRTGDDEPPQVLDRLELILVLVMRIEPPEQDVQP